MNFGGEIVQGLPAAAALTSLILVQMRRGAKERRERDRREDLLWGYTDGAGIRHEGMIETIQRTMTTVTELAAAVRLSEEDRKAIRRGGDEIVRYGAAERERIWLAIERLGDELNMASLRPKESVRDAQPPG